MQLARAGRKICTIRLGIASVAEAKITLTDGRRSLAARVLRVDNDLQLQDLTDQHAHDEGFKDRAELLEDLRKYYPKAEPEDRVTVIYFELLDQNLSLF